MAGCAHGCARWRGAATSVHRGGSQHSLTSQRIIFLSFSGLLLPPIATHAIHLITRRFLWARDTRRHRVSSPSAQPGAQTMPLLPLRIEVRPAQERSSATGAGVANPISLVTSCPKLDVTVPTKARVEASSSICTTCACVRARVSLRAHVWCESKVRATHARDLRHALVRPVCHLRRLLNHLSSSSSSSSRSSGSSCSSS